VRLWIVFLKTWREMLRDAWVLGLSLAFAPFFVLLYWLFTMGGSTAYTVVVINQDRGALRADGSPFRAGEAAVKAIAAVAYADGKPLLKTRLASDRLEAEALLRERQAVAFIQLPPEFSAVILALQSGDRSRTNQVTFGGDLTNPYYMVGVNLAITAVDQYLVQASGQKPLVNYLEAPLGASAARTEFEVYVPGILVFAVILMIFQAAMTIAREIESGTLRRLQVTPLNAFEFIGGVTLALVCVGIISVLVTFLTALALGFRSQGAVWVAVLVGAVTTLSVVGLGMLVAAFSRTVSQAFVVANFPLGLMMFFSGSIFPIPKVTLFTLAGHPFGLYDLLPATFAVAALNKVLTLGAGLGEVSYELGMLLLLSALYFGASVWVFHRMHMR
jgi:ABC-2 type transport system permease protein